MRSEALTSESISLIEKTSEGLDYRVRILGISARARLDLKKDLEIFADSKELDVVVEAKDLDAAAGAASIERYVLARQGFQCMTTGGRWRGGVVTPRSQHTSRIDT
ncbi:hypothetical protein EV1_039760 [Malus domestica]